MSNLSNMSSEELFDVLLCGKQPLEGTTLQECVKEWNRRIDKDGGYEVDVPPIENW